MTFPAFVPAALAALFLSIHPDPHPMRVPLAAQIHAESTWDAEARSPVGALGLTQFMKPTWGDIAPAVGCADQPRTNAECAMLAQQEYMRRLVRFRACRAMPASERLDCGFTAYNAGLGWVERERNACAATKGCNPNDMDHVKRICLRSAAACRESRNYSRKILSLTPQYEPKHPNI